MKRKPFFEDKEFREALKEEDQVRAEILLEAIKLEITPENMRLANEYIYRSRDLKHSYENLGQSLDRLFCLANGIAPSIMEETELTAWSGTRMESYFVKSISSVLKKYDDTARELFNTQVGKLVYESDNLENKIADSARKRADILFEISKRMENFGVDLPEEFEATSPEEDKQITVDVATDFFISDIIEPIDNLENMRAGIIYDFLKDLVNTLSKTNYTTGMFFLKELYDHLASREIEIPFNFPSTSGLFNVGSYIRYNPEKGLPDPEFFKNIVKLSLELQNLGGIDAVEIFKKIRVSEKDSRKELELVDCMKGLKGDAFKALNEFMPESKEITLLAFSLLKENKNFVKAYYTLGMSGISPEDSLAFLRDFGSYKVNNKSLADLIIDLARKPNTVKIIVENALYLCCGDATEDIINIIESKHGNKALRHYLNFVKTEEPYKQLAIIQYFRSKKVNGLEEFVDSLEAYKDEEVGGVLVNSSSFKEFLDNILELNTKGKEDKFSKMANLDLVSKYSLMPDINNLDEESLKILDDFLSKIKETIYESPLLGNMNFRSLFLEKIKQHDDTLAYSLSNLEARSNPYEALSELLDNKIIKVENEKATNQETSVEQQSDRKYLRILLISERVGSDSLRYLEEQSGIPLVHISSSASYSRFNLIRQGGLSCI